MPVRTLFSMVDSFAQDMVVLKGTVERVIQHRDLVENTLGLKRSERGSGWDRLIPTKDIGDEAFCDTVSGWNAFVIELFNDLERWTNDPPKEDTEVFTVQQSKDLFPFLVIIDVPVERWTKSYFRSQMEMLYAVLRGDDRHELVLGEKAMTASQAGAVINLVSHMIDDHGLELAVLRAEDSLVSVSGEDDGIEWCERCGAVRIEDGARCKKKVCPVRDRLKRQGYID